MQDTYLGNLLDKIMQGDESAYDVFLQDRLKPEQQCDLLTMLGYFVEQGKKNANGIALCYPEALIELAYYVNDISMTDNIVIKENMSEFIRLVFNAATVGNNPGALAAILTMACQNVFTHELPAGTLELEISSLAHLDKHQLYLMSRKYNYYSGTTNDPSIRNHTKQKELQYLEAAEAAGHRFSKYNLGLHYLELRVESDLRKAHRYIKEASELGVSQAMLKLGNLHDHDISVMPAESLNTDVDDPIAFHCYKQAATLGIPAAICSLGIFYQRLDLPEEEEVSDEERIKLAIKYYDAAISLGGAVEVTRLSFLYDARLSNDPKTHAIREALASHFTTVSSSENSSSSAQSPSPQQTPFGFFSGTSSSTPAAAQAANSGPAEEDADLAATALAQLIQKRRLDNSAPDPKRLMVSRP